MTTETIKGLNIEAGNCKTDKNDEQSTAEVIIHAVSDPNTQDVERTFCNFQCQEGYFDKTIGDKIPFKCVPNHDRTRPTGNITAPTGCSGACVICVLAFSIALYSGPVGVSVYYHQSLPTYFFASLFSDRVLQRKRAQ